MGNIQRYHNHNGTHCAEYTVQLGRFFPERIVPSSFFTKKAFSPFRVILFQHALAVAFILAIIQSHLHRFVIFRQQLI